MVVSDAGTSIEADAHKPSARPTGLEVESDDTVSASSMMSSPPKLDVVVLVDSVVGIFMDVGFGPETI